MSFDNRALVKTSQELRNGDKIAANKNGTIRRTNRKALTIGYALADAKKGESVWVALSSFGVKK
jgi:hypothetical protein